MRILLSRHQPGPGAAAVTIAERPTSPKGEWHGQRRAEKQSGSQETQEREDQDHCGGAKPEDCGMAAERRQRQEEIADRGSLTRLARLSAPSATTPLAC